MGQSANEVKSPLEKLYQVIKAEKNNANAELRADEIQIGTVKIKVLTTVEFDGAHQGKWIFAAKYETSLIDKKETVITLGSIGIGENKKDAAATSIDEWVALFGTSLSQMLAKSETGIVNGDFIIYPGLMGIRGEKPAQTWTDGSQEMNKKIINTLLPTIKKTNKEITTINLMIIVDKTSVEGECRINNDVSEEVLTEIKKLDWKTSQTGYMFKQFYLIKKKK